MSVRFLLALVPVVLASAAGCGFSTGFCTEIGCTHSLEVVLQGQNATGTSWPAGQYTFEVDAPEGKQSFTCALPATLRCHSPEGPLYPELEDRGTEVLLRIPRALASVTVTVSQDARVLGQSTLTPSYSEHTPNGPDCEPLCKQGTGQVRVTF